MMSVVRRWQVRYARLAAPLLLLALTLVVAGPLLAGDTIVGQDDVNFFYPLFSYLGASLGAGHVPVWNPYQFSGTPFAGDPQSGWMYLPAMVLYTLLPLELAAKGYLFFHLLLGGLSVYFLATVLQMDTPGALLAGVGYEFTGYFVERNVGCPPCGNVASWVALPIAFAELAIASRSWRLRALWWALSGFALSQILGIWLGQGSYYALIALGGYVAYRTLIAPPDLGAGARERAGALVLNGAGVLAFGLGLAAAGLLPRFEYNSLSILAGGYHGAHEQAFVGTWTPHELSRLLSRTDTFYVGGAVLALALISPFAARARHAVPYWIALGITSVVLTFRGPTPIRWAFFHLLPEFKALHTHDAGRILTLLYLCVALLAGATLSALPRRGRWMAAAAALPVLSVLWLLHAGIGWPTRAATALAAVLVAGCALLRSRSARQIVPILLVGLVFLDLYAGDRALLAAKEALPTDQKFMKVDLSSYYRPTGAAQFLLEQSRRSYFRYFGYDPSLQHWRLPYRIRFNDPLLHAELVNNRGTKLGLQDITGYNPVRLARYDEYMNALNRGHLQEYRESYVLTEGLSSPLLDLLDARYVVVPNLPAEDWPSLRRLEREYPTVYQDGEVRVLERTTALPRAWIVHSALRVGRDADLKLLSSGQVDPRRTALLERRPPTLGRPSGPGRDSVRITFYTPSSVRLTTTTGAPGLLVLSEVYYPEWQAYVDGRRSPLYVADHVLRALWVPAGTHSVVLRFESRALSLGLAISAMSYLALIALALLVGAERWRSRGRGADGAG